MTEAAALVRAYYEAFNAKERDAMLALLHEDVVHDINQGGRETGKAAFRAFLAHMDRCYEERLADVAIMASDDGSRVAAEFTVHGRYLADDAGLPPATGQRYVLPAASFFALEGGRIARVTTYYNLQRWIELVGG